MGTSNSLPQWQLKELTKSTNFKKHELKRWYAKFMKDHPDGQLDKEEFTTMFSRIYKSANAEQLAGHIFRRFDINGNNHISFRELMCMTQEKLELAFNVYDVDGNGSITMEKIYEIVKCMQRIARTLHRVDDEELQVMFEAMDVNSDGKLTVNEFVQGIEKNATFVSMLNGTYP